MHMTSICEKQISAEVWLINADPIAIKIQVLSPLYHKNIKNAFYDKINLRLFYFHVAKCLRKIEAFNEKRIDRLKTK